MFDSARKFSKYRWCVFTSSDVNLTPILGDKIKYLMYGQYTGTVQGYSTSVLLTSHVK